MLYTYIRNKQLVTHRIITLTSDTGEDLSTPAGKAESLNTYSQSLFVKDNEVDHSLPHFAQRNCTSCDDDANTIFSLEAMQREIDRLADNKAIGEDRLSPFVLKWCKYYLAAGPPLGDLRRCYLSLSFIFFFNYPGYLIEQSTTSKMRIFKLFLVISLSRPLLIIFCKSFSEGIAHKMWKIANVTLIHKKGNRRD